MAFKVFLSYSTDPDEQVIVWRLQTLAAASGIHVYVPQRLAFRSPPRAMPLSPSEVRRAIDECDCVLALITTSTSPEVENELSYALAKRKFVLPVVEDTVTLNPELQGSFPHVFVFSRNGVPGQIEAEVVNFLNEKRFSQERQKILGGLVAVGLGLLLLARFAEE